MSDAVDPDFARHRDRHFCDRIAWRRQCLIRSGKIAPESDEERRQAAEGTVKVVDLDTFRNPVWRKPK